MRSKGGETMSKYRMCIACATPITKSARSDPYVCRDCEQEMREMDALVPVYHQRLQ